MSCFDKSRMKKMTKKRMKVTAKKKNRTTMMTTRMEAIRCELLPRRGETIPTWPGELRNQARCWKCNQPWGAAIMNGRLPVQAQRGTK
jgi:hypothetical protein